MKKMMFILLIFCLFPFLLFAEDYSTYPWGIYSDEFVMPPNNENDYIKAKEAGIKWISIAALWNHIQVNKGDKLNWNPSREGITDYKLDARVNKAIASGFNIHFFVAGFPEWIAEKKDGVWKKEYPPKEDKFIEWKNWCKNLAKRYKGKVTNFEIYPEGEG
ncbi:MAG: hypothetical protein QMD92_06405, partial [bacterium]|nr:hypothetical protein [bacterium]